MKSKSVMLRNLILAVLFQTTFGRAPSQIRLDSDGGYTGIVVKIDKDVPEEFCPQILSNLQILLSESSTVLHTALDGRVYFKSYTIVIPSTWRDTKCESVVRAPRVGVPYRQADVVVTSAMSASSLGTQQSRGCGQPGDVTTLPLSFVKDWNATWDTWGNLAKTFVHEWSKLRYGIFDETGYAEDPLYPNYFYSKGEILPTGNSDELLDGVWKNVMTGQRSCDPSLDKDCVFHARPRSLDNVTCSLGYLPFLPNVTRYCDRTSGPMPPTKHNILCEGRSPREVIDSHADFANLGLESRSSHHTFSQVPIKLDPKVEIVREPMHQYVLVMETSASMDRHGMWKWINKAAQKFIRYDLPVNSNLAIVTFSNTSKIEHPMVQVHSDQVRGRLADTIPDRYQLSRSDQKCVLCSLQKVVHEVIKDNHAGAHVILVTQGSSDTLSITDETIVRGYIMDYNIKLSSIILPTADGHLPFYDTISNLMGGSAYVVHNNDNIVDFYVGINLAFAAIQMSDSRYPTEIPELVHLAELITDPISTTSSGTFLIDSTLGRDTEFGVYVEDVEEHLIKSISFVDSLGKSYGPFNRMSSSFDLVNFKTINYPPGQAPPFNSPHQLGMTWQYTIEWHHSNRDSVAVDEDKPAVTNSRRKNIVTVTSKPRSQMESSLITVSTWTSYVPKNATESAATLNLTGLPEIETHEPITVFAQVLRGGLPVLNGRVFLTVEIETSNGSVVVMEPVDLRDDGFGDPDIMAGDGVYSRYLGRTLLPGRYKLMFNVDDNEGAAIFASAKSETSSQIPQRKRPYRQSKSEARLSRHFNNDVSEDQSEDDVQEVEEESSKFADLMVASAWRKCCGSFVRHGHSEKTGILKRQIVGPFIYIDKPEKTDFQPPSRIGDFKIVQVPGAYDKLLATWTAPGGDYLIGNVASYRFVFSEDIADLLDPRGNPEVLLGFDRTDKAGTEVKFDFSFPHFDRDFYVGAYSFDTIGNKAKISNLVHVRLQSPPSNKLSSDAEPILAIATGSGEPGEPNWIMIGVIAGVIGVLLLLCIVAITYYFAVTRKRSIKTGSTSSVMNGGSSDETDSSSFDSDIKNIMAHPLGPALPSASSSAVASTQTRANLPVNGVHRGITVSGQSSSSVSPSDPPTETTSATVTPVYWSASQLLSKLDTHHAYGNPYLHQQHPDLYHHSYAGPHSLQPVVAPNNNHLSQPASIHNLSFSHNGGLYHNPEWTNGIYRGHDYPDEYTITVVGHNEAPASTSTRIASSSSCSSSPTAKSSSKVPPPVMPKPRNITQV